MKRRELHFGAFCASLVLVIGVGGFTVCSAGIAAPVASWSVSTQAIPTVLPREGEASPAQGYQQVAVTATNLGDASTTGPVTLDVSFEPGLVPYLAEGRSRLGPPESSTAPLTCTAGGQNVSCEGMESLPPGESIRLLIFVEVETSAPSVVLGTVEVSGGGSKLARQTVSVAVGSALPKFNYLEGQAGFAAEVNEPRRSLERTAAGHPYQAAISLGFPTFVQPSEELFGVAEPKSVNVTLPRGMYANPGATASRCSEVELETDLAGPGCPFASQIGVATVTFRSFGATTSVFEIPLFNMVPPPGTPAEFAFDFEQGVYVHLRAHVQSDGEYELGAQVSDAPAKLAILGTSITLWGDPTAESHDLLRGSSALGGCLNASEAEINNPAFERHCSTERLGKALLTLPSDCSRSSLEVRGEISSWSEPELFIRREVALSNTDGSPVALSSCGVPPFAPTLATTPLANRADSPIGLNFNLHQPQHLGFEEAASANLRDARVTLPEGISLNPSAANGLSGCSESQIGRLPDVDGRLRFSEAPQVCPGSAKIGSLEASTPLLDHALPGSIYVAAPFANPFGTLLSVYLVVEDEATGIVAKLAGRVEADPMTGQLTATFTENPELPIEDIDLSFFGGDGAALKTPLICGASTTTSTLVPWSTPEGQTVHPTAPFATGLPAAGTDRCPTTEAAASFAPGLVAGSVAPKAGAYSPFIFRLNRADGEQHVAGLETTLPRGLLGKLAGIPYCSEAQIAAARMREAPTKGALEQSASSCPGGSQIGDVRVSAGAGDRPYYVAGKAYLAGPYKGAPLSIVIITPAIAGPFDLGNVVIRVALNVDEYTAQIHAISDPLPTIIDGIPLDLRQISLNLNRPGFTLNPTSCREKRITGSVTSQAGASAPLLNRFQVGSCGRLGFKPKLKLSLSGSTGRSGHPALKAVLTYPKKGAYANIARAQVSLPHSEFLDQGNLDKVCLQAQLKSRSCPKRSVYGHAKAWSPLLDKPLEGPVYLGVGFGDKLPDLVAELNGQIRVLLKGKVDSDSAEGIRNTFEAVPDAPVSRFQINLKGGKKYGLLQNSENICSRPQKALTRFTAQNGRVQQLKIPIGNGCGGKKKRK